MHVTERRFTPAQKLRGVEFSSSHNSPGAITGIVNQYNTLSSDLGGFKERVAPGCFRGSLANGDDVKALYNHDPNLILGRVANRTLRLRDSDAGLMMECDLPDTSVGRDLYASVSRGDVSEMSFAFTIDDEDWADEDDPEDRTRRISVRTLRAAKLLDVSAVVYPAYAGATSVGVSSVSPAAAKALGRSHSYQETFPEGTPVEVRKRFGGAALNPRAQESRRRLFSMFVG
jgi:HK97 family phage prohead protease